MSESTRRISRIRRPPDATTLYWLMVALVMVIAPHFVHLPWWYPVVLVASIAERLSHIIYRRRPLLAIVRVILTLGCIAGIFLEYGTLIGRQPAVAILSCMLALKLLETYRRREVYLLVSLSYFVVVTQFLFSQSIYMSIYLTITVIVITATMYVVETQPHRENRLFKTRPLIAPIRQAGWLLVQGLPLMLCMFLLFPRLASPLWGVPSDNLDNRTGISGEMAPGDMTNLFNDDTPAFRAEFEGNEPSPSQRYWRGPVLWAFDGVTWTRRAVWQRGFADPDMSLVENPLRYRITLEPTQRFWLFGLDVPVSIPRDGGMLDDFSMYHDGPITKLFDYAMVSDADYRMSAELSVMQRRLALQLPQGFNPQTRELAEQWRSETSDPMALAQRALRMFRQQPFSYTLSPPPLFTHRVDEFLFQTQAGYCEHYASAFAVMMRAAGVPTRVVTGYQGGYSHPNGYILVRQSDAHAWNEIWVEGSGWVRVDPTAAVAPNESSKREGRRWASPEAGVMRHGFAAYAISSTQCTAFGMMWLSNLIAPRSNRYFVIWAARKWMIGGHY